MPKPDPPVTMTASTLRDYASVLKHNADKLEQVAQAMEREELVELSVLNFPSGKQGLLKMLSFLNAVADAFGTQLATRSIQETQASFEKKTAEAKKTLENARKPKNSAKNKREEGPQ